MTTLQASTEIGDDIKVVFSVNAHRADYGNGSPSFWDWDAGDVEIDSLEILGVDLDPMADISTKLREAILEYAADLDFED